ncbi:MAG: 16S rRNA (adenine(1518)-N(6)/adenine(1519)-N(6))-dimethyltransferase RsmA [Steroidobacterales bacterium]
MQPRKRFGQHFLHDPAVVRRIVDAIEPRDGERLVEIGPGRGALTWTLLERAKHLDAIEIDRDLAQLLRADPRARAGLDVHLQDVMDVDFSALRGTGPKLRIVGNLPYNISTPLLFHLLQQRDSIADMHFMLQREVVERMAAAHGTREYGRLTIMLAAYAEVQHLFDVGPGAFSPPPKVWSAIVRLRPSAEARFPTGGDRELRIVVAAAFSHRRKTLRNGLKGLLSDAEITACGVDPDLRPQMIPPAQWGLLAARFGDGQRSSGASIP